MIGAEPVIRRHRWLSPVWLLPALAALLAGGFIYQQYQKAGQRIQINFEQGNGILPGKTQVRYQGVAVGMVTELNLAGDGQKIAVSVKIDSQARPLIRKGSQFWLVSPKASLTEISGLDTLVSGNYINLQPGREGEPPSAQFDALDGPPPGWQAQGRMVHLVSDTLGSVANGAKVYYRGIEVGSVINTRLDKDDVHVQLDLVIDSRFEHLIKQESRFWNVGGIRGSLGPAGVQVEMGNLSSVLGGGIAFDSPKSSAPAELDQRFPLYDSMAAAERGEQIVLQAGDLPLREGMLILYQGLEIGRVLPITLQGDQRLVVARVASEHAAKITRRSELVLEGADLSLSGIKHAERLLTGPVLRLDSRPGAPATQITVVERAAEPGVTLTLQAQDLSGLQEGGPLWFKGIPIGRIERLILSSSGEASLQLTVAATYRDLLRRARFYKGSPLQVEANLSGIRVDALPASAWMGGGVRMLQGDSRMDVLFPSEELARVAVAGAKSRLWTLESERADGIGIGTPLFYRGLEAGRVRAMKASSIGVKLELEVNALYAPLLSNHSRFWLLPAVDAEVGGAGVRVKIGNLANLLRGGIEFENQPGSERRSDRLYRDRQEASTASRELILLTEHNPGLAAGAPLRYRGVTIGELSEVTLAPGLGRVELKARLDAPYAERFLRKGAGFQLVQAKLGVAGVAHLDTLIKGAYIEATPGSGGEQDRFDLLISSPSGLKLTLTSDELRGVSVGAPILFRKVAVGQVESVKLARDGSAVQTRISIEPEYAHLVRSNSRFWNVSGLKADVGLTGGSIEVETLQSLLAGGIAFNTPPQPGDRVSTGARFTLYSQAQKAWLEWQPLLRP